MVQLRPVLSNLVSGLLRVATLLLGIAAAAAFVLAILTGPKVHLLEGGWGSSFGYLAIAVLASMIAAYTNRRAKQYGAMSVRRAITTDDRAPVLYLRSFKDDDRAQDPDLLATTFLSMFTSEEELMTEVFERLGPVVALGIPGERLPGLGATREYVGHHEWQQHILNYLSKAALVLLRIGRTENLLWEFQEAIKTVALERIVLLVPAPQEYEAFRELSGRVDAARLLPPYPEYALRRKTAAEIRSEKSSAKMVLMMHGKESLKGEAAMEALLSYEFVPRWARASWSVTALIYFSSDGLPHFTPLGIPKWRRENIASAFIHATRPIFEQLGVPWRSAPLAWRKILTKAFIWTFWLGLAGVLAFAILRTH